MSGIISMPEELIDWIIKQDDLILLNLLMWIRKNPQDAVDELEAVVSRQAPAKQKRKGN